ncbi:MMPL family transporter [Mycobacterium sp. 1081908.1]|uniref:MMPL family transporter n=1 Tax=Mycobacterium sp. 1081908.1 TaxID=1834066 RepID=UPI0008015339|nr:MMPL family transporter [Mycobacterium sp. 1081908.1]OBK43667.1 hypothetical protein A5655_16280 [Mycobacterium sp. 1081908.1]
MLQRIARLAIATPRWIVVMAALLTTVLGAIAVPAAKVLSAGGVYDPASQSAKADAIMAQKFGQSQQQLLITVSAPNGGIDGAAREVGMAIADGLAHSPHVAGVTSPWTVPPAAAARLISKDHASGLIVASIAGDENHAPRYARELSDRLVHDRDGVRVRAGGAAMLASQVTERVTKDLILMESIAVPLSFLLLVWVFGGLVAAALPVTLGLMAITGSVASLRLIALATDVSTFALNISAGLGLALAIDYTLLIVSRYRDERSSGVDRDGALLTTMATAGRTVLFSAATVALAMAAMLLFPMIALKSLAYAGVATVGFAALGALVVTPAAIVLLGDRLNALDVRRLIRRMTRRPDPAHVAVEAQVLYRFTKFVARHAISLGIGAAALLVLLAYSATGVKLGIPDDRMLPTSAPARQVGDQLRDDYPRSEFSSVAVVVPDTSGLWKADLDRYGAQLSRVPDVSSVSSPGGTYVGGVRTGPPSAATGMAGGAAYLTVDSSAPPLSAASDLQLDRLHGITGPTALFGGLAQINRDNIAAITTPLPSVLAIAGGVMLVLLFLLTGSVVVPLKALVLNVLSLAATVGALVWIFQDGHLAGLGTTSTGVLPVIVPVPLLCIVFALSMDYEVFLVSRIREYWLASERTSADNDESVALGLARGGRVVTAAAVLMAIPFAAQIGTSVLRIFGVGLTFAILMDATAVRMVLLPAFMHLLGKWNWWAPKTLTELHARMVAPSRGYPPAKRSGVD